MPILCGSYRSPTMPAKASSLSMPQIRIRSTSSPRLCEIKHGHPIAKPSNNDTATVASRAKNPSISSLNSKTSPPTSSTFKPSCPSPTTTKQNNCKCDSTLAKSSAIKHKSHGRASRCQKSPDKSITPIYVPFFRIETNIACLYRWDYLESALSN